MFWSWRDFPIPDAESWVVRIKAGANPWLMSPALAVQIFYSGKAASAVFTEKALLRDEWDAALHSLIESLLRELKAKQAPVPDAFYGGLYSALCEERVAAIRHLARGVARITIAHLPSEDACLIWREEEARRVLDA